MEEGINLNLVLNGATLLSVLGLFVKIYLSKQPQKIEQPLEVRQAAGTTAKDMCNERHKLLNEQVTCLFARTELQGIAQAAYKATLEQVETRMKSMDAKLDRLIAHEE